MKIFLTLLVFHISVFSYSQQLIGSFKNNSDQTISLLGYDKFQTIDLGETKADKLGRFVINYREDYKGMAYLETIDKSRLFVVLSDSSLVIEGTYLNEPDSIEFINSMENQVFNQYAVEHSQRQAALAGWKYLIPVYETSSILSDTNIIKSILNEIRNIEYHDSIFLANIDEALYMSWYLPLRKPIDDMPLATMRYPEEIPFLIEDFRSIDFNDPKFITSGIIDDVIEGHFLMLENMGQNIDSVYEQMNLSIDHMINNLRDNNQMLNEVSQYLSNFLEKRSLFIASEYLALKLLSNQSYILYPDLKNQLETYRVMKIGNIASEISFNDGDLNFREEVVVLEKLFDINYNQLLIIFGASTCEACSKELLKISDYYEEWESLGFKILYISLDTEVGEFEKYSKAGPGYLIANTKGWESKPAKEYYIYSSPTMFIIDKDRKILLRPNSAEHANAWVKYKL